MTRPHGPEGLAGLAAFTRFARDPLAFLLDVVNTTEGCYRLPIAGEALVFIREPEWIDAVLADGPGSFRKDGMTRTLIRVMGHGLLTTDGERWRSLRALHAPHFTPQRVEASFPAILARVEDFVARLDGERNAHVDMQSLTVQILLASILDGDARWLDDDLVGAMDDLTTSLQRLMQTWRRLLPEWFPLSARRGLRRAVKAVDELVERLQDAPSGQDRLLHALREALSRPQLRDQLVTLIIAGHETTASHASFTLDLLARHPDVLARVQEELDRELGSAPLTPEGLSRLVELKRVQLESLRLYPPAWVMGREALEDCRLGQLEVRRGEEVVVSPWALHRDPRWYPEPDRFRPERWADGLTDHLPRAAFLPFGGGRRICVARPLALLETSCLLAGVVRATHIEALDDRLRLNPTITLRPAQGVRLRFTRRLRHP
jgi:cytochrome P450